jgi:hypothetical protein
MVPNIPNANAKVMDGGKKVGFPPIRGVDFYFFPPNRGVDHYHYTTDYLPNFI